MAKGSIHQKASIIGYVVKLTARHIVDFHNAKATQE